MKQLTFLLTLLAFTANGQTYTKTEILDTYSEKVRPLFGSTASKFKAALIRVSDSTNSRVFVLLETEKDATETIATSTSVAVAGEGFGVGAGRVTRQVKSEGRRDMEAKSLRSVINVFNRCLAIRAEQKPSGETVWRFDVDESFYIAVSYRGAMWYFVLSLDRVAFEFDWERGVESMKRLNGWLKIMAQND